MDALSWVSIGVFAASVLVITPVGWLVSRVIKSRDDEIKRIESEYKEKIDEIAKAMRERVETESRERTKQVNDLYDKYNKVHNDYQDLRVRIADDHYRKQDVDRFVERIENNMMAGFDKLLTELRNIHGELTSHITTHHTKGQ